MSAVDHFGNPLVQKPVDSHGDTPAVPHDAGQATPLLAEEGPPTVDSGFSDPAPSSAPDVLESTLTDPAMAAQVDDTVTLPVLGTSTVSHHQRVLFIMLGLALLILTLVAGLALSKSNRAAQQQAATGQSLMQSQRLAKSVSQALVGSPQAFPDVVESASVLAKSVRALNEGDNDLKVDALGDSFKPELEKITPLMERAERNAKAVTEQ